MKALPEHFGLRQIHSEMQHSRLTADKKTMTDEQHELADEQHELATYLKDQISKEIQAVVDRWLRYASPVVEETVRTLLTEQTRFWKNPLPTPDHK